MSIETGVSDDIRSGFVIAHTDVPQDAEGRIKGTFTRMYEAPEADLADYLIGGGMMKFYENVTHGTLRMFVIFAKATFDFNNESE